MIYLIGTRHDLQYTGARGRGNDIEEDEQTRKRFKAYLREKALELEPSLIGEEFSQYVLNKKKAQSTVKPVAASLGIKHRFCDPHPDTMVKLGIPHSCLEDLSPEEKQINFRFREEYWLEEIRDRLGSTIIFICGTEHVESFGCLLNSEGIETAVLHSDLCGG